MQISKFYFLDFYKDQFCSIYLSTNVVQKLLKMNILNPFYIYISILSASRNVALHLVYFLHFKSQ